MPVSRFRQFKSPRASGRAAMPFGRVVVMAKVPVLGLVKTRLGRQIGAAQATRIYRAIASNVVGRLSRDTRFKTVLALAPDAGVQTRGFDSRLERQPQGGGDIGARMFRAAGPPTSGPVVIVGTDIPSVRVGQVVRAFKALGQHDVVIGPAEDGGFWLIGFRRGLRPGQCFRGVRWSDSETLADVRRNLVRQGLTLAIVDQLSDVDGPQDLLRLRQHIGRRIVS